MRSLKFRAWNKKGKCWITFGGVNYRYENGTLDIVDSDNLIYEQYTGLKDKNGKEIYEGDIVESWYLNGDGNGGYYDAGNFEVVFKNGAFGVTRKNDFYTFDEIERDELEDIKVIGNIHENPELLGGEK